MIIETPLNKKKHNTNFEGYGLIEVDSNAAVVSVQCPPDPAQRWPERLHLFGHAQLFPHEVPVDKPVVVQRHWHQQGVVYRTIEVSVHYYWEYARWKRNIGL